MKIEMNHLFYTLYMSKMLLYIKNVLVYSVLACTVIKMSS